LSAYRFPLIHGVRRKIYWDCALKVEISISEIDTTAAGYEKGEGKDAAYMPRVTLWSIDGCNSWFSGIFDRCLNLKKPLIRYLILKVIPKK
jgi:hypothetical protein